MKNGSVITPDVGGTLYSSRLRVHDLGGLVDPFFTRPSSLRSVHDRIFQDVKPTFLFIHGYWARMFKLELDERFSRDYIPLFHTGPHAGLARDGMEVHGALYVRKDVATKNIEILDIVRKDLRNAFQDTHWEF